MIRWLLRAVVAVIGFAFGVAVVVAFEVGLVALASELFNARLMPRGLGWIIMPLVGGGFTATLGLRLLEDPNAVLASLGAAGQSLKGRLVPFSRAGRSFVAGSIAWTALVWMFVFVVEPFGSYWSSDEWAKFLVAWIGPVTLMLLAPVVIRWIGRGS